VSAVQGAHSGEDICGRASGLLSAEDARSALLVGVIPVVERKLSLLEWLPGRRWRRLDLLPLRPGELLEITPSSAAQRHSPPGGARGQQLVAWTSPAFLLSALSVRLSN